MPKISAIAAMTRDRVIGIDNGIPWHYPEDFKRFKRITLGSAIIMGRKTWESIGSKALPKRRNIVISRAPVANIECYTSIEQAITACQAEKAIWLIGGGQIYAQGLRYCDYLDITRVPDTLDPAGAITFPEIDPEQWQAGPLETLAEDPRLQIQRHSRHRPER